MNLNQLKVFHTAAELKSFTRAAEQLCLTQPGVSKHIKQLEDDYGVKLFDRIGRKVHLTRAGEILFGATQKAFDGIREAKQKIDDLRGLRGGELHIGASVTVGVYFLPKVLGRFMLKFPDIHLSTDISLSREVEEKVLNNQVDIGIVGHSPEDHRLAIRHFIADELMVIAPYHHEWSTKSHIHPHDLTRHTFIFAREGSGTRKTIEDMLRTEGIVLQRYMEFGNTEGVKKAVEAGLGISIVSKYVVAQEVSLKLVRTIPLSGLDTTRFFSVIYLKEKYMSHPVRAFLEYTEGGDVEM